MELRSNRRDLFYLSTLTGIDSQVTSLELDLSKEVLEKLVEYMRKRGGVEPPPIERPLRNRVLSEVCDKIDAEYIEELAGGTTRLTTLYEVILGAMFLDIRCLVHLGAAKIATMIKGQPLDKVKEMLAPQRT